jgi:hypothetical protein
MSRLNKKEKQTKLGFVYAQKWKILKAYCKPSTRLEGLKNVASYVLISLLCLVLNREAENIRRPDKAVSPTFQHIILGQGSAHCYLARWAYKNVKRRLEALLSHA